MSIDIPNKFLINDDKFIPGLTDLVKVIHKTKKFCGLGKMLFGLDFPSFTDWHGSLKESVDYVKSLETPSYLLDQGYTEVTDDDKRMILGGNAVNALGL